MFALTHTFQIVKRNFFVIFASLYWIQTVYKVINCLWRSSITGKTDRLRSCCENAGHTGNTRRCFARKLYAWSRTDRSGLHHQTASMELKSWKYTVLDAMRWFEDASQADAASPQTCMLHHCHDLRSDVAWCGVFRPVVCVTTRRWTVNGRSRRQLSSFHPGRMISLRAVPVNYQPSALLLQVWRLNLSCLPVAVSEYSDAESRLCVDVRVINQMQMR